MSAEPAKDPSQGEEITLQAPASSDSAKTTTAIRLAARRGLSLLSFLELARELTGSMDRYRIVDLGLYHLMGQLGIGKSAFWVVSEQPTTPLVLVRTHGIRKPPARAVGTACGPSLMKGHAGATHGILVRERFPEVLGDIGARIATEAGVALFASVVSQGDVIGFMGLGERVNGQPYGRAEAQIIEGSTGILAVALENSRLYNEMAEQHRRLRQANENLRELDRLKSEFLRNVNHELRTPITIILAYLSFLSEEEKGANDRRDFLEVIREQSEKLSGLLEKLLDFSMVSEGEYVLEPRLLDLSAFLRSYHQGRAPGVAAGPRELRLEVHPGLPPVSLDKAAITKVLDALVDNAIKFTPPGSHIVIQSAPIGKDRGVRIDIVDDGPGIPKDRVASLFDSFRQGDGSTTRTAGGMGMGLAFARRLVELMQGTLTVKSETGQGSRFTIRLAATDDGPSPSEEDTPRIG